MRKIHLLLFAITSFLPMTARAQTDVALDPEFGSRVSLSVDKVIIKGLHVNLNEEVRFDQNFGAFDRLQSTLGVSYKVHDNIKVGVGYSLINGYSTSTKAFKNARHRFMADVTGTLHLNGWNISLRERFQLTRRTGDFNPYQNPQNALMLKTRLMVKFKDDTWRPYAYAEMRNFLNAPVIEAAYDGSTYVTLDDHSEVGEAGWFLKGFNGSYINRWRGCIGLDFKIDQHNLINACLVADYVINKNVDANSGGTKLKSYTLEKGFMGWMGIGYEYSF